MTASSYKTVRNDMRTLMREAQELFREATATTGERAEELRNRGMHLLDSAVNCAQDVQSTAVQSSKEFAENADDFVKDNPWKAVAISAGVGMLVGMLLSRK